LKIAERLASNFEGAEEAAEGLRLKEEEDTREEDRGMETAAVL
jgi:hypothetical protein